MNKFKPVVGFLILLAAFMLLASPVLAQYGLSETAKGTGLEKASLVGIIGTIINVLFSLLGVAFFGIMIYAGILYLTSQGEPKPVEQAKSMMKGAVIGLIIVLAAYAITTFVMNRIVTPISTGQTQAGTPYEMLK